eukprot:1509189-Prymnesium_polylepis.1
MEGIDGRSKIRNERKNGAASQIDMCRYQSAHSKWSVRSEDTISGSHSGSHKCRVGDRTHAARDG